MVSRRLDLVGVLLFDVSSGAYFEGMADTIIWNDVAMGFIKSLCFGVLIAWICTANGFYLHKVKGGAFGAEGVSQVTTTGVVFASIAVLFSDYLISALML